MVSHQHDHVFSSHNVLQDIYAAWSSVNHVSDDIQGIIVCKMDFLQHSLVTVKFTMDI